MKFIALLLFLLSFGLGACVSINIGPGESQRASDVEFKEPPKPFEKTDAGGVDKGWKNPKNGNAISFISDCGNGQDPSLTSLRTGVLSSLQENKVIAENTTTYNGREGLRTQATGKVDGVVTKLDLMIFKKNSCIYILTYVSYPETYETDIKNFENFLAGFQAP